MKKYKDYRLNMKEAEKIYESKYYVRVVYFIKCRKDNNNDSSWIFETTYIGNKISQTFEMKEVTSKSRGKQCKGIERRLYLESKFSG